VSTDPWTDKGTTSTHRDGHRVGLFQVGSSLEWWAYPAGWKPRGTLDPKGPFRTRNAAKEAMDPTNFQNWITPQIDFDLGASEPRKAM